MWVLGFLLLVATVAAVRWWWDRRKLHRLAARLGGHVDGSAISVTVEGLELRTRYDEAPEHAGRVTYVDAQVPPSEPLVMLVVRHQASDRRATERGAMIDLTTGDEAFDRAYRVEVAPAALGLKILDHELRAYLMRRGAAQLRTEDGTLRLAVSGWLNANDLREAIAIVRRAVANLRTAQAELAQLAPSTLVGGPHRGIPTDAPVRIARAARGREVERLDRLFARRKRRERLSTAVVVALVLGVVALEAFGGF